MRAANPTVLIGRARFRLLGAELFDGPGRPSGPLRPPEVLLCWSGHASHHAGALPESRRQRSPRLS